MVTTRVGIPRDLINYLRDTVGVEIKKHFGFKPNDSQVIESALRQLQSNMTGKEFEVKYNKKKKCLIIK